MRIEPIDAARAGRQRFDARYRLFVFEGPSATATTLDLHDASLEDALDMAARVSGSDERLWSLALVEHDDETRSPRLTWLSGMDYRERPRSAAERRRRARMQDRLLARRDRLGLPLVLPEGLRVIRLFPEWVAGLPLWENFADPYRLGEGDLDLPPDLVAALLSWNDRWQARPEDAPVPPLWHEDGLRLWARLQDELAGVAEVRPDFLG